MAGNGSNQHTKKGLSTRPHYVGVRLSDKEHERLLLLMSVYDVPASEVLRAGIYAFERDGVRQAMADTRLR